MRLKKSIILVVVLLAAPTPLLAQASGQGGVASQGPGASPAVGMGLAASPNAQPVGGNASAAATTTAATGSTREVPGRFSPRKVCVYNVGVQLNGRSRAARINNDVDLRNVRMECR